MAHRPQPERFAQREQELLAKVGQEGYDPMRGLAEQMLQHVLWQTTCIEDRIYHPKGRQPKDILGLAERGQLFALHRELADAFVRIARVHAVLDNIEGTPKGRDESLCPIGQIGGTS